MIVLAFRVLRLDNNLPLLRFDLLFNSNDIISAHITILQKVIIYNWGGGTTKTDLMVVSALFSICTKYAILS